MQENYINKIPVQNCQYPAQNGANAVSINIYTPQAYATNPNGINPQGNYYSMYGENTQPNLPLYPQNYNNMINQPPKESIGNERNALNETDLKTKTGSADSENKKEETKTKKVVPLTDDYIKSLENYLNNDNPKIRLIGAKDLMERFKEDENRKDSPNLIPLLNKILKDSSPAVRFLGLTTLQLGYSVGNEETVQILKQIQSENKDSIGEDALLASEILLKLSAPQAQEIPTGDNK